jgi:hypothetical protein
LATLDVRIGSWLVITSDCFYSLQNRLMDTSDF